MPKKRKQKPSSRRLSYLLICLLVVALFTSGWLIWRGIHVVSPRCNSILVLINHESQNILPGETLSLHPLDRVKILKISTNILLNFGVRLVAKGFDATALRYEEMSLSALLPEQDMFDLYKFRIRIKYRNQDLGYMDWVVQPYREDWLEKADRIISEDKRLAILERALGLLPDDSRIKRRLLEEYKLQKQWKQAASMLEEMAAKTVDSDILIELMEVYTSMSDREGVVSVLKRLVKLDPDDLDAQNQLAELLEEAGSLKQAIREYEALLKRTPDKNGLLIYKRLGYLYTKSGQSKKAVSHYLEAVKLDKRDANLYYNLSYLYGKLHEEKKAYAYLARALELKSGDLNGRLKLAQWLTNKGKLTESKRYLSEILKKKPKSTEALLLMAKVVEKQGKKQELKKIYQKILSLDPKNETVVYNLGGLEYEAGNLKASLHHFKIYIKSHPDDATVHEIIFDIYKKLKNAEMAYKQARILVELRPKGMAPYYYMFEHLNALGEYNKIIRVMEKGLKVNPDQTDLREYLVLAYLKTGKEKPAMKEMEEILKARPGDIELLDHLARLREKNGRLAEALEAYKRIIDISPDNEVAQENYLRLRLMGVRSEGGK